ncbi:MAG TPA: hypothetical protein H9698_03385 [Candidatus Ruthenibacterium merdavium]|uniref:Lipoprotein n=1 Tax=Candidatus Ruthenibacterium merdavium TaxID=2838752 RepID=A0A9D2Q2Q3_9FIRM|nr:hypothetical protein [Candidatus Ruthenibacterium merdavium]
MNKKVIGFICGVAACSVLTACSGQEAAPTAASVSQSAAASESVSVSESVSSVSESVSSVAESVSSSPSSEYEYQTSKEFTEEEAAIYKDQETLDKNIYQESYDMYIRMGLSEEEAAKMAQEDVDAANAHYEETKKADEAYRKRSEEVGKWYGEELDKLYMEHIGMTFDEFMQIRDGVEIGKLQYKLKQSGFYEQREKLDEERQVRLHGE